MVAVVGNGIMGHGIAQVFATAGEEVVLIGRSRPSLDAALERIRESLDLFERHGLLDQADVGAAFGRLRLSTRLEEAAGGELVGEAVLEDPHVKLAIFEPLDFIFSASTAHG